MSIINLFKEYFTKSRPKSGVVLVAILLMLAGLISYSNFTKSNSSSREEIKIESGLETIGSISGGAIGPELEALANPKSSGTVAGAAAQTINEPKTETRWLARDISRNTISEGAYKVQKGDTLWEIAEGKYGSGFEWKKILAANKDKIGFLADGSQALIEVGQELSLP